MKKLKKLGVAIVSASVAFSIFPTVSNAAPTQDVYTESVKISKASKQLDSYPDVNGDEKERALKLANSAFSNKAVLRENESVAHPHVVKRLEDGSVFVAARIDGATKGSAISFTQSPDGKKNSTFQVSLHEINHDSGRVQTFENGKPKLNQVVSSKENKQGNITPYGMNWGRLNECLSNAGIAAWAIAGLSIACAATAGFGCYACLTAASGATGATVAVCAKKSWE